MGVRRLEGEEPLMSHWRTVPGPVPAPQAPEREAQYVRRSTAHQKYSTENQEDIIGGYLNRLLSNPAIERHLTNRHPELVDEFRAIIAASSLDEAAGGEAPPEADWEAQ